MAKKSAITPVQIRKLILEQSYRAKVGHIASCLSIVDILVALYGDVMQFASPQDPARDRFILSKGHAALALYCVLHAKGHITKAALHEFHNDGSNLGVHPEYGVPGIELMTGSLGQGLSTAIGVALAARLGSHKYHTYVLLSDAECNEGSVWEGVMFAAHHKLNNLTVIVDLNGQQGFGYTHEVMSLSPMTEKWRAFGWNAVEVDGHDLNALTTGLKPDKKAQRPKVVLARTVAGKGVSFMESQVAWHYLPMSEAQYTQALQEIEE